MFSWRVEALQDDSVRYAGQPIALVVAETLEAATEGARLLAPTYETEPARIGFDAGVAFPGVKVGIGAPGSLTVGDLDAGLAAAARVTETTIETPLQYHNAMEPHAIVAAWDGDRLTIDTPNQAIGMAQAGFAAFFGIPPEDVTIRSPFLGGGFGSKAILSGPQILACLAARSVGRPVKLVLRRDQMYGPVGHRGSTRQHLRLGADAEGRLTAIAHHAELDHEQLRRLPRTRRQRLAEPLRQPGDRHRPHRLPHRHRHPRPDARTRRGQRLRRPRMRDGRGRGSRRPRSARVPPAQLRRDRPRHRQALLVQGAARMLCPRRRTLRLGRPPAGTRTDARLRRAPRRLGHGHGALPRADVPRRGPGHAPRRRDRPRRDLGRRHGPGRVDGAGADRRRRARPADRADRIPRRPLGPPRRRGRRRLRPHGDGWQRALLRGVRRDLPPRPARHRRPGVAALRRRQRRGGGARRPSPPPRRPRPPRALRRRPCPRRRHRSRRQRHRRPRSRPMPKRGRCSPTARSLPR